MQVQHPVRKAFPSSSTNEDRVFSRDERENFFPHVFPLRRVAPLSQKREKYQGYITNIDTVGRKNERGEILFLFPLISFFFFLIKHEKRDLKKISIHSCS